ncbi:complement C5 [Coregonus clupeaformis]|uniref:complement C5 n=1 Tax=Coregonus clupeaformis TaxID=59861 RepID=UPI001E1C3212|nr:complement C5 [Coregonus clupeaformis]
MKLLLFLCVFYLCCLAGAQEKTYLITAPKLLRLDASEKVVIQLFGYTQEANAHVYLKSSMDAGHIKYADQFVTLNSRNGFQEAVTLRIFPSKFPTDATHAYLEVILPEQFAQHVKIPVSRKNGFLFIQTDKPIYTPEQSVKVRVFSLNEDLQPALRPVTLTFRDPELQKVDIVDLTDINGIPSMQNPFKIPLKPKLGIWRIEASYQDEFTTTNKAEFEVKEYVLPSLSIHMQPQASYISFGTFEAFKIKISARYIHGAPVANAEVFLRFGYIGTTTVILHKSVRREQMSESGDVEVNINMKKALSFDDGPKELEEMVGKFLYVAVMVQEPTGGISQEAEMANVKFLKSPYSLSLVATPPFIKPGLPYTIRVSVKDHLGEPVARVPVRLVNSFTKNKLGVDEKLPCPVLTADNSKRTNDDGIVLFICNLHSEAESARFIFKTADEQLPSGSQAEYTLEAKAYLSPNERYLYIDLPSDYSGLQVGQHVSLQIYFHARRYLQIETFSYQIISRGKIVKFASEKHIKDTSSQAISFTVTSDMVPSIRLLVYYILYGEKTPELVADSVWIDVKDKCVNGLKTELSFLKKNYKPKDELVLEVKTGQDSLVALSAIDTAVYSLRAPLQDPVTRVLRHIEQSDQGCGGGGGKDNADVFRLTGLTFMTNANAQASQSEDDTCTASVRPKRALSYDQKKEKAKKYGRNFNCCWQGLRQIPTLDTCAHRANGLKVQQSSDEKKCRAVFTECCDYSLKLLQTSNDHVLARVEMAILFDLMPTQIRSFFPESWLWEVQPVRSGQMTLKRNLPDSLTTWEIKAVGVFKEGRSGICVADPIKVPVTQAVSVDVPLPYSMVRGEQIELRGSVYNQAEENIKYCVTLTAGPGVCLFQGKPTKDDGIKTTSCDKTTLLESGSVGLVTFTLMALEVGSHTLTFTLRTDKSTLNDQIVKTIRVVPEGIRTEDLSAGTLDPQGLYGPASRKVEFSNNIPSQLVPKTSVERLLIINGEILGEVLAILNNPDGLRQLVKLPSGSAEGEIMRVLPIYFVYHYLETTGRWDIMGPEKHNSPLELKGKIREGITSIMSFRRPREFSYSMWKDKEASTWLTALVVKTLGQMDKYVKVDSHMLSNSISWLIDKAQNEDGSFREFTTCPRVQGPGVDAVDQSVFFTSFVMIGIKTAMAVENCGLLEFSEALKRAAVYISDHAPRVKSLYARAVAAYALTLDDRNSMQSVFLYDSLEKQAREGEEPVKYRYWREKDASVNPLKPDKASAQTVETTSYVLLTALIKGKHSYAQPIINWLTQDQRYGGGFHSTQDTILTLEALTEYSKLVKHAKLDLLIEASYIKTREQLGIIALTQKKPVGKPIEVFEDKAVRVSTGFGSGYSHVQMKTVYYKTTQNHKNCKFDISIQLLRPDKKSKDTMLHSSRIVACAKYKPPPNEVFTESSHTVMEIQLPTGVQPFQEDLNMFRDGLESVISDYKITEDKVVLQLDSVPMDEFVCVGFRIKELFRVGMVGASLFKVYEYNDPESQCFKLYSPAIETKLLRLCVEEQCHCMAAECCNFKSEMDPSITAEERKQATCSDNIKYAFKVKIKSIVEEGDFITYVANVEDPFKRVLDNVNINTEVDFVKKASCSSVDMKIGGQYLIMGADSMQIRVGRSYKYRYPLDSQATVEMWPTECEESPACTEYVNILNDYAERFLFEGC